MGDPIPIMDPAEEEEERKTYPSRRKNYSEHKSTTRCRRQLKKHKRNKTPRKRNDAVSPRTEWKKRKQKASQGREEMNRITEK